ncbi:MAG: flippase-like domain-containing protein [Chloroflexi bacterium]|nr:flippase-like domain-containing protein [Chloroflexota bacterium]
MGRWRRLGQVLVWGGGTVGASALGAIFLRWALQRIDWGAVNHALAVASVPHFLSALGLMLAAFLLRGVRWRLLFRGARVSTWRLALVENTAVGVNSLSPIPLLDEPTRVGLLTTQGVPTGTVLATLATMRTFELATQGLIGLVGLVYLPPLRPLAPYFLAAAVLAVVAIVALFTLGPLLKSLPALGRLPLARGFSLGVEVLRQAPLLTFLSFLATVGYSVLIGLSGWMLGLGFGLQVGLLGLVVLSLVVIFFTDWLPGLPGAIGTFEFVALYLLGLWEVDREAAFGYAVLLHALFFVPPLLVAAFYLPYAGFRSVGAVLQLARQPWHRMPPATASVGASAPEQPASLNSPDPGAGRP